MAVLKFLWGILINIDLLLIIGIALGAVLICTRFYKGGKRMLIRCLIPFLIIGYTPLARWMITSLEGRFPPMVEIPETVEGFILLGGSFSLRETKLREEPIYNKAGSRLFEFVALIQKYPYKKVVVTGTPLEVKYTREVFDMFGVDQSRVIYEGNSKNTQDNARLSYNLVRPVSGTKWVLVTSAYHMPRAVGLFEGAGWTVIPYPVNYMSTGSYGKSTWILGLDRMNFAAWRVAMLQWAGLVNHYLEGDTKTLYPKAS